MFINHIDIPVPDLAATRDFLVRHFDFTPVATLGQNGLAILKDARGTVLVLSRAKSGAAPGDGFHIGFLLDSREAVDAAHARLQPETGCTTPSAMRGGYTFYLKAPGPILIEVGHRP